MGDIFDQAAKLKKPATGDIFDQAAAAGAAPIAPPPGTPSVKPPAFMGGPTKEGSSAGQSPLIANAPASTTAGTMLDTIKTAASDLGGLVHPSGFSPYPGTGQDEKAAAAGQAYEQDQARQQPGPGLAHGRGLAYRATVPLAESVGVNVPGMEQSAAEGSQGGVLGHAVAPLAALAAGEAVAHAPWKAAADAVTPKPINDMVKNAYSQPGDHISASLRSNTKVDVPAEAKIAAPAIEEGLNDRGIATKDFKGRNGPTALQAGIDNAIDIQEARAKSVIDPIRSEVVDPQVLAKNPELAARFADKEGNIRKGLTYGDLDAERIKMNKELRTSNFYSKAPSAQYAVADPLANLHDAANQARDLVYDKAGEVTGFDLRPLKQQESSLIKLGDLAETTKNTLSAKAAQRNATPLLKRAVGSVQGALSVKANPINAFSIPEKSGLFDPTGEFNANMKKAFPNLKAAKADRTVVFPNYNLNLTSPGAMPPTLQRALNLTGGENVPGENLKLTSPVGKIPPAPNAQEPLPFEGSQNIPAAATPDILGRGIIGPAMELTPPGDMPPALQRVLGFQNPGVPSELYPGVKNAKH